MVDPDKAIEAAGKGIDLTRDLGQFLDKLLGEPAKELGGVLSDQVRFWRAMRLLNFKQQFDAELTRRGLNYNDLRALPLGQSVPLIEAASMEDSDDVQELWAKLLASTSDPESGVSMKKVYTALLKELGPCEAALIDLLRKFPADRQVVIQQKKELEDHYNALAGDKWRKFPEPDRMSAIGNLRRLGLISPAPTPLDVYGLIRPVQISAENRYGRRTTVNSVDERKFERLVNWLVRQNQELSGVLKPDLPAAVPLHTNGFIPAGTFAVPEFGLLLTPLGQDLVGACYPTDAPRGTSG